MSLQLFLTPGTTPSGQQLPGNAQALVNFIAQYTGIAGADGFSGMNYGSGTPTPENRQYPWFQTDSSGNPVGLFSWNGSDWVPIPSKITTGNTAQRPLNPTDGTEFFDLTINVALIYYGGSWHTLSGSPGDIKFVTAATVSAAITANPGWVEYTAAAGRVIGASGSGSGLTTRAIGATLGEENHQLTINELAGHTHSVTPGSAYQADGNVIHAGGILAGAVDGGTTGTTGGDSAHNTMQPTLFAVCLVKQ